MTGHWHTDSRPWLTALVTAIVLGKYRLLLQSTCLIKMGWRARCTTHDTRNIGGHDLGPSLGRTIQCYLLLQLNGTISFLNGPFKLVNCHVSYALNNYLVKSVDAYVPTHTMAHQLRQSTRALIVPVTEHERTYGCSRPGLRLGVALCCRCGLSRSLAANLAPPGPVWAM